MNRVAVEVLAVVAALGGLLVTAANRWGADQPGPCRDTVTGTAGACLAPASPAWALVLGALLPACAVAVLALAAGGFRTRRPAARG